MRNFGLHTAAARPAAQPHDPGGFIACSVCTVDLASPLLGRNAVQRDVFILAYAAARVNLSAHSPVSGWQQHEQANSNNKEILSGISCNGNINI
jgi:hypothetical protein